MSLVGGVVELCVSALTLEDPVTPEPMRELLQLLHGMHVEPLNRGHYQLTLIERSSLRFFCTLTVNRMNETTHLFIHHELKFH